MIEPLLGGGGAGVGEGFRQSKYINKEGNRNYDNRESYLVCDFN
jgi:hypothetical protein